MEEPTFASDTEALAYYTRLARSLQSDLDDTKLALDEFQVSSKELETELERELQATEKQLKELRGKEESLLHEIDQWKTKYHTSLKEHTKTMTHMQAELETCRKSNEAYRTRLRDMELDNDELEGKERMVTSSLQDVESKYGKAIERITLLEDELIEKSKLEEEHQRLKDDLRDMTEELAVLREHMTDSSIPSIPLGVVTQLPISPSPSCSPSGRLSSENFTADLGLEVLKDENELSSPLRPVIRTKPTTISLDPRDSPRRRLASMGVNAGSPKTSSIKPLVSNSLRKAGSLRAKIPVSASKPPVQTLFTPNPHLSASTKGRTPNPRSRPTSTEITANSKSLNKGSSHLQSLRAETERMQGMTKKLVSSRNSRIVSSIPVPKTSLATNSAHSKSIAGTPSALNRSVFIRSPKRIPNGVPSTATRHVTQPATSQDRELDSGIPRPQSTRPLSRLSMGSDSYQSGIPMIVNNRSEHQSISGLARRKESIDLSERFSRPMSSLELSKSHSRRQSVGLGESKDKKTHPSSNGLGKSMSASIRAGTFSFRK